MAPPVLSLLLVVELAGGVAPPPIALDGVGTPEVNGTLETVLAPLNAGEPAVAEVDGAAEVFFGLSTSSMTCTTPLETRTFGVTTLAPLTKTLPSSMRTVTFDPPSVCRLKSFDNDVL